MADKRTEIETAARSAIKRGGLASVSFRTLADEVGVKSASVHYHFPTKADLAQSVVRAYSSDFEAALGSIAATANGLAGKLNGLVDVFEGVLAEQNLCLCGMMSAELAALDEVTQASLKRFFTVSESWLEGVFETHRDEVTISMQSAELAKLYMASLEGATLVDRVHGTTERLAACRRFAEAIVS